MMAKQKALETTIADMKQAMAIMAESHKQVMGQIQEMFKGLPDMIKKAIGDGNNTPEETQEEQGWGMCSQESEMLMDNRESKRKEKEQGSRMETQNTGGFQRPTNREQSSRKS
ncbi:hypothetical protein B0O80DRAFT_466206 [Mortierella sp. GBAus27b]|nr:hypothetical protein B0O80DRAFT_466197 [Mortierella sp. GBAus27b]KAI8347153.1 hypothetical protein B0O80DRAFT_466206 [Mortierella sp. GBAus27b]